MSAFSRDSLQLVSAGLDPQGHQQYRQRSCGLDWETEDTLLLISGVQQSLCILVSITVIFKTENLLFRGKWHPEMWEFFWESELMNSSAGGKAGGLGVIRSREAACLLQRSYDLPHCQVQRHTKSSWTWLNQETITCNANWVWKGLHRLQGVSLSCVSLKQSGS